MEHHESTIQTDYQTTTHLGDREVPTVYVAPGPGNHQDDENARPGKVMQDQQTQDDDFDREDDLDAYVDGVDMTEPLPLNMLDWNMQHVIQWLKRGELAPVARAAAQHRLTGVDLVNMSLPTATGLLIGTLADRERDAFDLLMAVHFWHEQVRWVRDRRFYEDLFIYLFIHGMLNEVS